MRWAFANRPRRRVRYGVILVALVAAGGLGLASGTVALGDTVCGSAGDISFCAQWGVRGYVTTLAVKNTGTQPISSFVFTLPSGTTVYGTPGNTSCSKGPAANQASCNFAPALGPGQTTFTDMSSSPTPAVGSTGTLTMKDGSGVAQPDQQLTLDKSSVCTSGSNGTTCPLGPAQGQCDWTVKFSGAPTFLQMLPAGWAVRIQNAGTASCPAAGLTISTTITAPLGGGQLFAAPGNAPVPSLAPGQTYGVSLVVERAALTMHFRDFLAHAGRPEAQVAAGMPEDADGCCDESDRTSLGLSSKLLRFVEGPSDVLDVNCPGRARHSCDFVLWFFYGIHGGARDATVTKPFVIGSAHGRVKPGKRGHIHFKLTTIGRRLLRQKHKLGVTVVGTRTAGSTELLVKGHLTLSLTH